MSSVPEACLAYTSVFTTLKLECAISVLIGFAIGYLAKKWQ